MTSSPPSGLDHLSTLALHQLRYGELEGEAEAAARRHLDSCPTCNQRFAAQQAFRAAFELKAPPIALPEPAGPSLWERARGWLRWAPAPALALAAALVLFVQLDGAQPSGGVDGDSPAGDQVRLKGQADIQVIVEDRGALDPGERIVAGDRIQLRIPQGPWQEAWVGDGEALIGHFALDKDGPSLSPFALTVDGEAGDEELVVLLAEEPLGEDAALAAMQGRRMKGVELRRLHLQKAP